MFRTLLCCSVVLAVPCAGHAQTATIPPPFDTKRFEATVQGQSGSVCVGPGYKLIGGGARVEGAGNLLSSYPDRRPPQNCWLATALGGGSLKMWAVGVRDTGSQWDVIMGENAVDRYAKTWPKVTISMPPEYALTGGGARIQNTTTGGLAASYPTSITSWEAIGAGFVLRQSSPVITSYIIGIKPAAGGSLKAQIKPGTGSSAPDTGFTLTGGGARITSGDSLLKSMALDGNGWSASATSGTSIVTQAIAIQSYPASSAAAPSFDTSWDTLLKAYWDKEKEEHTKTTADAATYNSQCIGANATSQSPIALSSTALTTAPAPSTLTFTNYDTATGTAQAENTGHSYQLWLDPSDYASTPTKPRKAPGTCSAPTMSKGDISVKFEGDTTSYKLNSYHFHHPSEHVLDGVRYPLEMHIVHQKADDETKKLVLGVFLTPVAAGETADADFAPWAGAGKDETWKGCLGAVNTEKLLPSARSNLQYDGSLTTPFCAQGVKWVVYTTPVKVSKEVFEAIKSRTPNSNSARPLQTLNNRVIK